MADKKDVLIKVNGLKTYYPVKQGVFKRTVGYVKAVDDVNLDIYKGEILGVVGESGCGKTTLGKSAQDGAVSAQDHHPFVPFL